MRSNLKDRRLLVATALFTAPCLASCFGQEHILDLNVSDNQGGLSFRTDSIPDITGDGFPEIVVACPDFVSQDPGTGSIHFGVLRVYSGYDGALLYELLASGPSEHNGTEVKCLGDIDGDGLAEIATARAPDFPLFPGAMNIISGVTVASGGTTPAPGLGGLNGFLLSFDAVGDLDGDGRDEFIVGQPPSTCDSQLPTHGTVKIYSVLPGQGLTMRSCISGTVSIDGLGLGVAGIGDANLDGFPDVLASTQLSNKPSIYTYTNGALSPHATCTVSQGQVPERAIDGAGDTNADGYADVIMAGGTGDGFVWLFSGKDGVEIRHFFEPGTTTVAGGPDLDHDGADDYHIGQPTFNAGPFAVAGRVTTFSGMSGTWVRGILGDTTNAGFGREVNADCDFNLDGVVDMVVVSGSPAYKNGVDVFLECAGQALGYGNGCSYSGTTPIFALDGCVTRGALVTFRIEHAPSSGIYLAQVLIGATPGFVPGPAGCNLLVSGISPFALPVLISPDIFTHGTGETTLTVPYNIPSLSFAAQAFIPAPAPPGYLASNGVVAIIP